MTPGGRGALKVLFIVLPWWQSCYYLLLQ